VAAVSELEKEYEGRITFTIIDPAATESSGDVEVYELETHGLVGFDSDGQKVNTIPGHQFGRDEIVVAIEELLASP
jgi:hypothetical protein